MTRATRPLLLALLTAVALTACTPAAGPGGGDTAPGAGQAGDATPAGPPLAPPTSPPPSPSPRVFTLAATGDVLPHTPVIASARAYGEASGLAHDFGPMFDPIRALLDGADLALCHLEVPLSRDGTDLTGYPSFNSPPELAGALAGAGYDGCSTASNHSLDRGLDGVVATLDVLDGAGLAHVGTARSQPEDDAAARYEAGGVQVAQISGTYGLNGREVPAEAPWAVDLLDAGALLAEAARARAEGAEFVVASLHWGTEYQAEPTAEQRALAAQLLASPDVDLILGHHAHVVQPVERIGGEVVVYGLGNLLSNQSDRAATQDGVVLTLEVREDLATGGFQVTAVRAVPTWVARPHQVLPAAGPQVDPATPPDLRAQLDASAARTAAVLGPEVQVAGPGG